MSIDHLIEIYVALALGALCALGIYSDMRRRRFWPTHSFNIMPRPPMKRAVIAGSRYGSLHALRRKMAAFDRPTI